MHLLAAATASERWYDFSLALVWIGIAMLIISVISAIVKTNTPDTIWRVRQPVRATRPSTRPPVRVG